MVTSLSSFVSHLSTRGLVRISGHDSLRFLQALVTSDLHSICPPNIPSSPSAFLNARGRLVFGTFLYRLQDSLYLIDLPKTSVASLIAHLTRARLRAKVDIVDVSDQYDVHVLTQKPTNLPLPNNSYIFPDSRLSQLGFRAIVAPDFDGFNHLPYQPEQVYTRWRILHGVPDDNDFNDTPLPLDLALHLLNGVSFEKGCYLGQELTARSHFTGVLRKRITPIAVVNEDIHIPHHVSVQELTDVVLSDDPQLSLQEGATVTVEGSKKGAVVSSSIDNIGMVVLRMSDAFGGKPLRLNDGRKVVVWRPDWWENKETGDAVLP